jgi:hypothetical protein
MAVLSASRKVGEIFLYQGPSTNVYFQPHYYIELSKKQVVKKIKALSSYRTQIAKGIVNLPWIQSLAGFHGLGSNAKYAEAFALNHLVKTGKNV